MESLWILAPIVEAAWLARLASLRLLGRYRLMAAFCFLQAFSSVTAVLLMAGGNLKAYWYFFLAMQIPIWTLAACIVVDTHNRAVEKYRGFYRLGELLIWLGLGLSAAWVLGITVFTSSEGLAAARQFLYFQERNIYIALLGLAIVVGLFIQYFRLEPVRNVKIVYFTMLASFVGNILIWASRMILTAGWEQLLETAAVLWHVACLGTGALLFSGAGEEATNSSALEAPRAAVDEAALLGRLEAINSSLLRVLRS